MKYVLGFLVALPLAATAQVTTLDYQGGVMSGQTFSYSGDPANPQITSYSGAFTAEVILNGSGNNLTLVSYEIAGPLGMGGKIFGDSYTTINGVTWDLSPGAMTLTSANGAVTGASFKISAGSGNAAFNGTLSITPNGDSFTESQFSVNGTGTEINGSGAAGIWSQKVQATQAPEMDPASAGAGMTLLCILAILARRRI